MEPAYAQIKKSIEHELLDGKWKPGELLYSESKIATLFGTSRITAIRVLKELAQDKYIRREKGRGSIVVRTEKHASSRFVYLLMKYSGHFYEALHRHLVIQLERNNFRVVTYSIESLRQPGNWEEMVDGGGASMFVVPFPDNEFPFDMLDKYWRKLPPLTFLLCDSPRRRYPAAYVISDFPRGGTLAAEHVIKAGYGKIVFYTPPFNPENDHTILNNIREVCQRHGKVFHLSDIDKDGSEEAKIESARKMLVKMGKNCAVLSDSDHRALIPYKAALSLGWKIPEDVGIIGYWNTPWSDAYSLTSVSLQEERISEFASDIAANWSEKRIVVPSVILNRKSCRVPTVKKGVGRKSDLCF